MAIIEPKSRAALGAVLSPMGLGADIFERAIAVAAADSRNFSLGAPKSAAEATRWFRTVEVVHEGLMLMRGGWERTDPQNLPYFVNMDYALGLVVSSGDTHTGVAYGNPRTRSPKGAAFAGRVRDNWQDPLFSDSSIEHDGNISTWVLLYHERAGSVYSELSRPVVMLDDHVDEWSDRIIFPGFDLTRGVFDCETDDAVDFSFTIVRR